MGHPQCQVMAGLSLGRRSVPPRSTLYSLLRWENSLLSPRKFPVPWLREFGCNRLIYGAESRASFRFPRLNPDKFPVFSRETGKYEAETGSPMTASTAS
jgi:hypothetical protein